MTERLTHGDIESLLGAYALDAVDGEERERVDLHLRDCPRCRAEVADHREVAARLAYSGITAPDGVWDRIAGSLEATPPQLDLTVGVPGGTKVVPLGERPRRRSGRTVSSALLAGLGAVALVAVVVLGVGFLRQEDQIGDLQEQLQEVSLERVAQSAFDDPDARKMQLISEDGELRARMAVTPDGSGYLLAAGLPFLEPAEDYQLWQVVDGQAISLGTFHQPAVVPFGASTDAERFTVTREARGGVAAPAGPAVVSTRI